MRFPNPEQTTRNCKFGCGVMTVLGVTPAGQTVRVHCGTWQSRCPGSTPSTTTRR